MQIPMWSVWNVNVIVPAPFAGHVLLTLIKDTAAPATCNMLMVSQVLARLHLFGATISDTTLRTRLSDLPGLRRFTISDATLLGPLKELGVLHRKASRVQLASCAAIHGALRSYPELGAVADVVRPLGRCQRDSLGGGGQVTTAHLANAAAADQRSNRPFRRPHLLATRPPTTADEPFPTGHPPAATSAAPQAAATNEPTIIHGAPASAALRRQQPAAAATPVVGPAAALPAAAGTGAVDLGGLLSPDRLWFYKLELPLPTTLPNVAWKDSEIKVRRLGILAVLGKMPSRVPLKAELDIFKAWCTQAHNFSVGGRTGVAQSTYRSIESTVSLFIGYCFKFEGVPQPYLSLRLFSNPVCRGEMGVWAGYGMWE